jgi:hypothetical protein
MTLAEVPGRWKRNHVLITAKLALVVGADR